MGSSPSSIASMGFGVGPFPPQWGGNGPLTLVPFCLCDPLVIPFADLRVSLFRVVIPSTIPSTT